MKHLIIFALVLGLITPTVSFAQQKPSQEEIQAQIIVLLNQVIELLVKQITRQQAFEAEVFGSPLVPVQPEILATSTESGVSSTKSISIDEQIEVWCEKVRYPDGTWDSSRVWKFKTFEQAYSQSFKTYDCRQVELE